MSDVQKRMRLPRCAAVGVDLNGLLKGVSLLTVLFFYFARRALDARRSGEETPPGASGADRCCRTLGGRRFTVIRSDQKNIIRIPSNYIDGI